MSRKCHCVGAREVRLGDEFLARRHQEGALVAVVPEVLVRNECLKRSKRWPEKSGSSPRFFTIHSMKARHESIGGVAVQS